MGSHEDTKLLRPEQLEALAAMAIDCGYRLHRDLGPGLLESAYETLLAEALRRRGAQVERQVVLSLRHDGIVVDNALKIDLLVERSLVLEVESTERVAPVHGKQVLTYLRLMELPLGLVMNFGQSTFKDGLKRVANDYFPTIGKL